MLKRMAEIEAIAAYPSDSNFILFRAKNNAERLFRQLADKGILIRNLAGHPRLADCLRVTIGNREENDQFLDQIRNLAT